MPEFEVREESDKKGWHEGIFCGDGYINFNLSKFIEIHTKKFSFTVFFLIKRKRVKVFKIQTAFYWVE